MLALWGLSLRLRDVSIVDVWWGPGFAMVAWVALALGEGWPPRSLLLAVLVSVWGLRLGGYLLWRNHGKGEDPRYAAMRRHHGERFAWLSLVTVFGLQGLLQWIVSLPVQVALALPGPPASHGWTAWDAAGVTAVALGLACESVADLQLARFKADPANAGKVMDRGLWRWSRHPNYFGDALTWWGIFLVAAATPAARWTAFAPALMTFLLLRVSGVALLERDIGKRRPEYADYVERTSAFVPWFPKRRGR
jgi:steroid 5-alpha reductase family enzyme